MKEYIKKEGNHFFISNSYNYYILNNNFHGLFRRKSIFSGLNKGYYNMDEEYGHWKEYGIFNYYL